ncbi:hypothetical protein HDU82_001903 [Entophlyctis luteolus]|nr:hypothetical protein HDU82_001903 [Entophlyctis luteolus]
MTQLYAITMLMAVLAAHAWAAVVAQAQTIQSEGGWSLSLPAGSSCPSATSSCFSGYGAPSETATRSDGSGVFDRGQQCCPSGLTTGTNANTGQPFPCCPQGNPDCRGSVENRSNATTSCADTTWALWRVPTYGNAFCCLPGYFGFWESGLGQDAIGQCQSSNIPGYGMTPAIKHKEDVDDKHNHHDHNKRKEDIDNNYNYHDHEEGIDNNCERRKYPENIDNNHHNNNNHEDDNLAHNNYNHYKRAEDIYYKNFVHQYQIYDFSNVDSI